MNLHFLVHNYNISLKLQRVKKMTRVKKMLDKWLKILNKKINNR